MSNPKHLLVLIHGITPQVEPEVNKQYAPLLAAVREAKLPLSSICTVRWGIPQIGLPPASPDQYLTPAEAFVGTLVRDRDDAPDAPPGSEPVPGRDTIDWGIPGLRRAIREVRESVVLYGLSDAIYYASPDGERAVRDTIFAQVFGQLEANDDAELHLHIVAHSLGVTVAHDFLYALFGTHDPSFPDDVAEPQPKELGADVRALQLKWRSAAHAGRLKLGTFVSFASQLPLFVMRKQALVERLARRQKLDPSVIGIDPQRRAVQWAIFYDRDELLGFSTRALYEDTPAIVDISMNSGLDPLHAHLGYWHEPAIVARCIALLRQNIGG